MSHHRRVQRDPTGQMRRGHRNGHDWVAVPNDYFHSLVQRIAIRRSELLQRLARY